MGLFSWLFRNRQPRLDCEVVKDALIPKSQSEFVEIRSRNFYGKCYKSPNNRYALAMCDANENLTELGSRRSGPGRYLLIDGTQIIFEGKAERPNDGKIANNGTYILNDWGFGDGLQGTFCAFDVAGRPLIKRRFNANLYNNGLSPDGHFAVCQTCISPDSGDGGNLFVFDLTNSVEIAHWEPESGWV